MYASLLQRGSSVCVCARRGRTRAFLGSCLYICIYYLEEKLGQKFLHFDLENYWEIFLSVRLIG